VKVTRCCDGCGKKFTARECRKLERRGYAVLSLPFWNFWRKSVRTWRLSDARTHLGGSHDDLLEPQDAHNPKACTKRYCCISINKKNLQSQRQLPEAAAFTRSGDVSDRRVLYLRHPLKFVRSHVLCYLHQPRAEHYAPNEVGDSKKNLIVPTQHRQSQIVVGILEAMPHKMRDGRRTSTARLRKM
jgi:hypothetical protein